MRYRAGRAGAELGGDFYDAVEASDGEIAVLIGDVAGHGPDAAALAARLRSAWRALTLAGLDQLRTLTILDEFLRTEVESLTFATVAVLVITPDREVGELLMAGHPPPVLVGPPSRAVGNGQYGPLLGVMPDPVWKPVRVELGAGATLLLYTDGLIEGRTAPDGKDRVEIDGLIALADDLAGRGLAGTALLDGLLAEAVRRNGGPLTDDVALCLVSIPASRRRWLTRRRGAGRPAGRCAPACGCCSAPPASLLLATLVTQLVLQAQQRDVRNDLLDRIDPSRVTVADLRAAVIDQETGVRGYAITLDERFLEPYERGGEAADAALARLQDSLAGDEQVEDELAQVEEHLDAWRTEYAEPALAAAQAGQQPNPEAELGAKQEFDALRASLDAVDRQLDRIRRDARDELDQAAQGATAAMFLQVVGLVASGVLITVALGRVVTGPLSKLGRDARMVADGDLTHEVRGEGSPDLVRLGADVDAMRRRILAEVDQLNAATADLARQAEELARSNDDLEQFAYVASHDLQEPLRKVSGFCQLLQMRYADQLDERANEYIHFAVDGAKRMQDLINDLLAFSRVGRTRRVVRAASTSARVVAGVVEVLGPAIEDSNATVTVGDLPVVAGDRRLLGATLQNLISNALKFRGPEAPVVTIDATLTDGAAGDEWVVTVADNGIGVDPAYGEQIFTIFKRLHNKTEYAGTGIGLALAKKIVEFHGGRIWLEPTPAAGCHVQAVTARRTRVTTRGRVHRCWLRPSVRSKCSSSKTTKVTCS